MMRVAVLGFVCATAVGAQSTDTARPEDPVVQRARLLVQGGRESEARRLVDSVLRATPPDTRLYAEALYWRASNANTAADAERDYRRLLIESPLSLRAEDALLQLANLEQARGDRRGASDLLQRFLLTYANSPARPRVVLSLVRLLFEQGPQQQARACEAFRLGRETIPPERLELRNQLEYYAPRCMMAADAAPTVSDSTTPPATTPQPSAPPSAALDTARTAPPRATASLSAFYSVQVAAYDSREPASRLVALLTERGIDARVDGTSRPFRVRVGKYGTRSEAVKAAATLKAQGHNGFITLVNAR